MTKHILKLPGCTLEPLGNYLKALGVFRLVAEQADTNVQAWWKNGMLNIATAKFLSTNDLIKWLYSECAYTAFLAPWSTNTGWGKGGKRDAGGEALKQLLSDNMPRTERFRVAADNLVRVVSPNLTREANQLPVEIQTVTDWVVNRSESQIITALRSKVREQWLVDWLDSVAGIQITRAEQSLFHRWFPLFAKGGAEGSGNYIVRQQEYLADAFCINPKEGIKRLETSIACSSNPNILENNKLSGLFYPGFRGDPNIGQSFTGETRVNTWDFILLLEGMLLFSSAVTRRFGASRGDASFPFYCEASMGGSSSISLREIPEADKSINSGEIWCPIWKQPLRYEVLKALFKEGRFQTGDKTAYKAVQFALAVTRFGCDRGISSFIRYGLIRRSGSYGKQDRTVPLGVPLGFYPVISGSELSLLESLIEFDMQLSSGGIALGVGNNHPARLLSARAAYEGALFDTIIAAGIEGSNENSPKMHDALLTSILTLSKLVREFATTKGRIRSGKGSKARMPERPNAPLPSQLSSKWLNLKPSGNVLEYRLARSIAGIEPWGQREQDDRIASAVEAIRANLLPLKWKSNTWQWDEISRSAVWSRGATLFDNFTAVLRRRLIDASKGKGDGLPLWSKYGASFSDLLALWHGEVDENRLADLIHALALIDTGTWKPERIDAYQQQYDPTPDLHSSAVWFDNDDKPRISTNYPEWNGKQLLSTEDLECAFALPRFYSLLKLCFIGGRLPARPTEKHIEIRRGNKKLYPPHAPEILNLLHAGRLFDAVEIASRKLNAKGYPAVFNPRNINESEIDMSIHDCRRLAGMLLIPVRNTGVLAALAIKPRILTH
jgi:CRISPR-associated protein Csx17